MKRVIVESPFAGDVERNLRYLRACLADCLRRGEAPFASHAIYTQPGVLDDTDPVQRAIGITAGFAWRDVADATVVYVDLGITEGMRAGISDASRLYRGPVHDHAVEIRRLGGEWSKT
jgi:hypothetical protein